MPTVEAPVALSPSFWQEPTTGWAVASTRAVLLLAGGVAHLVAHSQYTGLERRDIRPAARVKTYNSWRVLTVAGYAAGGTLGVAGATLLLLNPPPPSESVATTLVVGPGRLGIQGQF